MVFLVIFHVLVIVLGPFIFGDMMGMLERAVTVLVVGPYGVMQNMLCFDYL